MSKLKFITALENRGWVASGFGNMATTVGDVSYRCQLRKKGFRIEREVKTGWIYIRSGRYTDKISGDLHKVPVPA